MRLQSADHAFERMMQRMDPQPPIIPHGFYSPVRNMITTTSTYTSHSTKTTVLTSSQTVSTTITHSVTVAPTVIVNYPPMHLHHPDPIVQYPMPGSMIGVGKQMGKNGGRYNSGSVKSIGATRTSAENKAPATNGKYTYFNFRHNQLID
jgi:hypothetical protein